MLQEYIQQVFTTYQQKKKIKNISLNLINPTPGGLKEEVLKVYVEREMPSGQKALRSFFGPLENNEPNYVSKMENIDVDKFRPLVNFLNGKTNHPVRKNVELLEWLLLVADENFPDNEEETIKDDIIPIEVPKKYYKAILAFLAAMAIVVCSFVGYKLFSKQYMYWVGDHYVGISYFEDAHGADRLDIDHFKLENLKKINRRDTITTNSIRKIYYHKINKDSIDLYTSAGELPTDTNRRLMPLTNYMFEKYVLKQHH